MAWRGGCALLGLGGAGAISTHAHYAIQLAMAAPTGLTVQFGRTGAFEPCAAALIPSGAPHTIDLSGCQWSAVIFIEPETPEGKALTALLNGNIRYLDAAAVHDASRKLDLAWRTHKSAQQVTAVCMQLVQELAQVSSREPADPRVLAVVEYLHERVDQQVTLAQAAAVAHLSPSRLRHLFVAETGMPLRTYVLWRRLLHVWTLLMQGETLSGAAHAAGFADSAHLSRTSRKMFGLAPSAMQMAGPISSRASVQPHHRG